MLTMMPNLKVLDPFEGPETTEKDLGKLEHWVMNDGMKLKMAKCWVLH